MTATNGTRPQPSCATCDFMRREGNAMRCYWDAPTPVVLGAAPNRIQGAPPVLMITGISPEVHPGRFCRHHPELRGDGQASPGAEPKESMVLLPHEGTTH